MSSTEKPRRIVFFPLFLIQLIQMIRYGELEKAIELAGREIRLVREHAELEGTEGSDQGSADGVIMVPSPSRAYELGYTETPPDSNEAKGLKP
jgi:hypothetical protein